MFVDSLRKDFFELLLGHRVLLIAGNDVDSVCCVKILEQLLRMEENPYILLMVDGMDEFITKYQDYRNLRRVVMINCGGVLDLMKVLDPPPDVIMFILDSHRPTNLLNIYNTQKQIRVVVHHPNETESVPKFDEIFNPDDQPISSDSESDDEESDTAEDESSPGEKRKRRYEKREEKSKKRKELEDWKEKRRKVLHNYNMSSHFGLPATLVALEVAWSKQITLSDMVWYAIIALTESLVLGRMARGNYTSCISQIQQHVARITHEMADPQAVLNITFKKDFFLYLYRQWNIYASIKNTPNWRCKFRLWTSKGIQRLHSYLVEVGLPLKEVRQEYMSMNFNLRNRLQEIMNRKAEDYGMSDDMYFGTFFCQFGWAYQFSALDHYLSVASTLEEPGNKSLSTRFLNSLQALCKYEREAVESGIEIAKLKIDGINSQVQILLDLNQVQATSDLLYCVIQWGTLGSELFCQPSSLILLAKHLLETYVAASPRGKSMRQLPLVLLAPKTTDTHYVVGIPPLSTDCDINLFGKAYEAVAKKMDASSVSMDFFDRTICIVNSADIQKFLEILVELMS